MNADRKKYSKITAIISLALLPSSILVVVLTSVFPAGTPDSVFVISIALAGAMQIAAFVLGIIAVKCKPSGLSITALVLSILVIVLEVLFIALTIWMLVAACTSLMEYLESPEFMEILDGCASMGFLIGR